ncbi:hypothetical protein [Nakamurella multipartita]|uniref:Uncharacterized protein n=1 Tax=Nakamurella multipartita (strain ATCC 700099 / DSM 44233 / CIP 104796 / JCM 9543 / NBRC 105858 / Y-104) TaxID=479431 RepID=C8X8F8_NAKMY|nr:hypothetical protein [Nakamurella multipartita]ACV79013.1 hypothetical protein Namu_2667 [Nakamurella multipartita DSM 44233]
MRIPFIRTENESGRNLMLALAGRPHVIAGDHPKFDQICDLLTREYDAAPEALAAVESDLLALIDFADTAIAAMRALTDRVTYLGGTLFFDGDPIHGALADHIVAKVEQNDDSWTGPVNFLENLAANPARHVRKRLYRWISDRGMTITEDGLLVGYKGVHRDEQNTSITAGSNTVWVDGVPHTGHIPNPVGATLVMARSEVDNERDAPCSQGLHVGTHDYASGWAGDHGRLLLVAFNPRDVVAIPRDAGYAKIRVCRYTVLDTAAGKLTETTWRTKEVDVTSGDPDATTIVGIADDGDSEVDDYDVDDNPGDEAVAA